MWLYRCVWLRAVAVSLHREQQDKVEEANCEGSARLIATNCVVLHCIALCCVELQLAKGQSVRFACRYIVVINRDCKLCFTLPLFVYVQHQLNRLEIVHGGRRRRST